MLSPTTSMSLCAFLVVLSIALSSCQSSPRLIMLDDSRVCLASVLTPFFGSYRESSALLFSSASDPRIVRSPGGLVPLCSRAAGLSGSSCVIMNPTCYRTCAFWIIPCPSRSCEHVLVSTTARNFELHPCGVPTCARPHVFWFRNCSPLPCLSLTLFEMSDVASQGSSPARKSLRILNGKKDVTSQAVVGKQHAPVLLRAGTRRLASAISNPGALTTSAELQRSSPHGHNESSRPMTSFEMSKTRAQTSDGSASVPSCLVPSPCLFIYFVPGYCFSWGVPYDLWWYEPPCDPPWESSACSSIF
eukprot:TRINITY_DN1583_c0_g1_i4.p1 TRINITY_DN1583_c0_g1~~TRINITY_DN1583_c0_g1_i4.p1  ORF type:complete len:355 (+),score=-23.74 TRINITY_DN1583_c0_g1_i4:159-1067(+)